VSLNTRDLKYLTAYSTPAVFTLSVVVGGYWGFATIAYVFGVVPILELLLPQSQENLASEEKIKKIKWGIFDLLLYTNLPIVFGLLAYFYTNIVPQYDGIIVLGYALSLGIVLGANGINVAHELGHRTTKTERFLGKLLLCPALYMHFYIEHNFGHHLHVATPEDGATAKYNQTVYSFWITSVSKQYIDAWKRQIHLLKANNFSFFSIKNDMLWYHFIQPLYLLTVYYLFSFEVVMFAFTIGVISFLFLESINYIEHYGLKRFKTPSGRYERVQPHHSWNSNFNIGRIVLYELTRHSDHHYKASKKYQILNSYKESPTLPLGYPASLLLSFIPPLWFKIINPLVPDQMKM